MHGFLESFRTWEGPMWLCAVEGTTACIAGCPLRVISSGREPFRAKAYVRCSRKATTNPDSGPPREKQEIDIGFGVALAAGARAEQHDFNRYETLAQEPRCRRWRRAPGHQAQPDRSSHPGVLSVRFETS